MPAALTDCPVIVVVQIQHLLFLISGELSTASHDQQEEHHAPVLHIAATSTSTPTHGHCAATIATIPRKKKDSRFSKLLDPAILILIQHHKMWLFIAKSTMNIIDIFNNDIHSLLAVMC